LQELESKYRACEQLGIEASAEMQAAARRVLDENKKLRTLLMSKGMTDAEIEAFMETDDSLTRGGSHSLPSEQLEILVSTRKPCPTADDCCSSPTFDLSGATNRSPRPQQLPLPPLRPSIIPPSPSIQPPLPLRDVSSSPDTSLVPLTHSAPFAYSSNSYRPMTTQVNELPEQAVPAYSYNYPVQTFWQSYDIHQPEQQEQHDQQQQQQHQDVTPDFGNTSCVDAANIIRNMKGDVGPELESDLGCRQPGSDCKVENSVVFEVLEKYTS
jgi:hypothetical protein